MLTYNYPEITDYFGRKIKLDWAEDSEYDGLVLPDYTQHIQEGDGVALLTTFADSKDPSLKHIVKAAATAEQFVLGNGTGVEGVPRKLNASVISSASDDSTECSFTSYFTPTAEYITLLLTTPYWFEQTKVITLHREATGVYTATVKGSSFTMIPDPSTTSITFEGHGYHQYSLKLIFSNEFCTIQIPDFRVITGSVVITTETGKIYSSKTSRIYDAVHVLRDADFYILSTRNS